MSTCDILVIGGGMAGMSAAAELAAHGRVLLLERESQPGYHSTGRSAATLSRSYGPPAVRRLVAASLGFLEDPPAGFVEGPILSPRGKLVVAPPGGAAKLQATLQADLASAPDTVELSAREACDLVPVLRPERVAAALCEPLCRDIDVDLLLQGYQRRLKQRGGELRGGCEVIGLSRSGTRWQVRTNGGELAAPVVVNAAGAWADQIGALAGLAPLGLSAKRRTAFTFDPPDGLAVTRWPITMDSDEQVYFKPEAGRILGSPADATPVAPQDVQPEELDLAVGVDRIETLTSLQVRRLTHKWAGLRTFAPDGVPVAGFDETCEGFFWLAGQGGYGIKTAPALSRLTAALVAGSGFPDELARAGLSATDLAPARLRAG